MADILLVFGLLVGGGGAAELVRSSCRRRLLTPIPQPRSRTVSS